MTAGGELERVLFLCRGSVRDGLGHVIRTRTVARLMSTYIQVRIAVIGDPYTHKFLNDQGLDFEVLDEESQVQRVLSRYRPHIVVVDLETLSEDIFKELRSQAVIVCLSPIFSHLPSVDILFNRARLPEPLPTGGRPPLIRSGPEYTVISPNCTPISEERYQNNLFREPMAVAICMGGTDSNNKTKRILTTLKEIPRKLLFWVLLGEGYPHSYQELVDGMKGNGRHEIILAKTHDSMWRVLGECSVAILAGGITTYEAAYAGLPSINALETPDHLFLIQELIDRGVCVLGGVSSEQSTEGIRSHLVRLEQDRQGLLEMHRRSRGFIDAYGTRRIVEGILESYPDLLASRAQGEGAR